MKVEFLCSRFILFFPLFALVRFVGSTPTMQSIWLVLFSLVLVQGESENDTCCLSPMPAERHVLIRTCRSWRGILFCIAAFVADSLNRLWKTEMLCNNIIS